MGRTQTFTKFEGQFEWGRVTRLTSQILAGPGHGPDQHAMLETFCWLEDTLTHGQPQPSKDLEDKIEEEGYRPGSVKRAKRLLGIVSQ